ncbi:CRC domain-containing protein TSO1 [Drosophila guanche]|uniref:Blast:Condensin-2 complex subunit D3 n=1 Tax=Drosophila guanche TaxID=7266 RepID=A0A3B0JMT2_DROGU|nr:CRC domain-containing protein TSO1 [Drosophila guanche]SPP82173.1 blast:Condensin-2 complex subunit D3 [Drosophila guanche]
MNPFPCGMTKFVDAPAKAATGRRQPRAPKQPKDATKKGCACKRTSCIKNYCDCYQSMRTCHEFCKCLDCKNTVERPMVNEIPPKHSRRQRASAVNAKAEAAALRAGIKPAKGVASAVFPAQEINMPPEQPISMLRTAPKSTPIKRLSNKPLQVPKPPQQRLMHLSNEAPQHFLPAPKCRSDQDRLMSQPWSSSTPRPTAVIMASPRSSKPKQPEKEKKEEQKPKELNLFNQPINMTVLHCMLVQAIEAEQLGLQELQVGQMVLSEFVHGQKLIYAASCDKK